MAQLASYYGAIRDTVSRFDARGFEARCEAPRSSSSPYLPLASASIGLSRRIGERCRASRKLASSFFIHSETFETKVSTSQRTSLARACKFASRVFYIDAYTRVKTCTRMHIYIQSFSAHWRRLYIAPLSEDIRACVDNKLASFHQSPSSFREPPSSLSLSLSTSESPLDRVQTQSLQARASRRFSLFDYIGLYHDPLGYYLLYQHNTCIRTHTYTHIHYFIRNERLVLSFVYSFAPSLCIV